jgi:hypothetical protein
MVVVVERAAVAAAVGRMVRCSHACVPLAEHVRLVPCEDASNLSVFHICVTVACLGKRSCVVFIGSVLSKQHNDALRTAG